MNLELQLSAGYGARELRPPLGTPFGGFAIERQAGISAIHDPLVASAVVASDGERTVALVSCDLQLIHPRLVAAVRRRIAGSTRIPPDAVMVHATHDHAAPGGDAAEATIAGLDRYFSTPAVESLVVEAIHDAVCDACADLRPATLATAVAQIEGIGDSRHRPLPGGQFGGVARFDRVAAPSIVVANHGCHASVLGPDNTAASADYPGVLRRRAADREELLLFINGPAGDVSTRATRREQTFEEMERLGGRLDGQLEVLGRQASSLAGVPVAWETAVEEVAARPIDVTALARSVQGSRERLAEAGPGERPAADQALCRALFRQLRLSRLVVTRLPVELQAFRIGGLAVVGVGGELFSELGDLVRRGSPATATLIAAPVNGSAGNIPTSGLAAAAGAMVAAEAGHAVTRAARALVERLFAAGV